MPLTTWANMQIWLAFQVSHRTIHLRTPGTYISDAIGVLLQTDELF